MNNTANFGFYFFYPISYDNLIKYSNFFGMDEIFIEKGSGIQTGKDDVLVQFSKETLYPIIEKIKDSSFDIKEIVKEYGLEDTSAWKRIWFRRYFCMESIQVIGNSLYNVSISLMYTESKRKHRRYLNYDISTIFKENRDELSKLLENEQEKFRDFIDSIRKTLFLKIESFDHTKTEIPKGQTRLIF